MIELCVVDEFGRTMFKVDVQDYLAMAMGDSIRGKYDKDDNFIGRTVDWEAFKRVMDRAY